MADISNAFVARFSDEVHKVYQAGTYLNSTVRSEMNVVGSTQTFPLIGTASSVERTPNTVLSLGSISHTKAEAVLKNWVVSDSIEDFDQAKVNWSLMADYIASMSEGMGRRTDQVIIDALVNTSLATTHVVTNSFGSTGTASVGLTNAKILAAREAMNRAGVPATDRYFVMGSGQGTQMFNIPEVINSDYATQKVTGTGILSGRMYQGFKFIEMADAPVEGGLPVVSGDRTCFAYHKRAVGLAVGKDMNMKSRVDYAPTIGSHVMKIVYMAGAVGIDPKGIVSIACKE